MALQRGEFRTLASQMRARKEVGAEPFVWVLGVGAGIESGAPSTEKMIEGMLKDLSNRDPGILSVEERLAEFYNRLDNLNDYDRYLLLNRLFKDVRPPKGYDYLAHLVKSGFANIVLSTNFDTFLEDALHQAELPGGNAEVFIVAGDRLFIAADGQKDVDIRQFEWTHLDYNTAAIRNLIRDAFTPRELWRFCQDRPIFQLVCTRFGQNPNLEGMVDVVMEYCAKKVYFSELLSEIRGFNPRQYERHSAQLYRIKTQTGFPAPRIKVLKLHGDLSSRTIRFTRNETSRFPDGIRDLVTNILKRELLVVGLGVRDADLFECFPQEGGGIWYADFYPPTEKSNNFERAMSARPGSWYIDGEEGSFDTFFTQLHDHLVGKTPIHGAESAWLFTNLLEDIKASLKRVESTTGETLAEVRSLKSVSSG